MTTLGRSNLQPIASVHTSTTICKYLFQRPSDAALTVRGYAMYNPLLSGGEGEPERLPSVGVFMSRSMGQVCHLQDMKLTAQLYFRLAGQSPNYR